MRIIITENQLSVYVRRRIVCFEDFMSRLEKGEKLFPTPRRQLNWDDFKILIGFYMRSYCDDNWGNYNEDLQNKIIDYYGDRIYKWYIVNI